MASLRATPGEVLNGSCGGPRPECPFVLRKCGCQRRAMKPCRLRSGGGRWGLDRLAAAQARLGSRCRRRARRARRRRWQPTGAGPVAAAPSRCQARGETVAERPQPCRIVVKRSCPFLWAGCLAGAATSWLVMRLAAAMLRPSRCRPGLRQSLAAAGSGGVRRRLAGVGPRCRRVVLWPLPSGASGERDRAEQERCQSLRLAKCRRGQAMPVYS